MLHYQTTVNYRPQDTPECGAPCSLRHLIQICTEAEIGQKIT